MTDVDLTSALQAEADSERSLFTEYDTLVQLVQHLELHRDAPLVDAVEERPLATVVAHEHLAQAHCTCASAAEASQHCAAMVSQFCTIVRVILCGKREKQRE